MDEKKKKNRIEFKRTKPIFRHPFRPEILHNLRNNPTTVPQLSAKMHAKRQTVNYHIKALAKENLVQHAIVSPPDRPKWKVMGFELTTNGKKIADSFAETIDFENTETDQEDEDE